jgi:pimeloyl-ACP methyl ester carboxylesterase
MAKSRAVPDDHAAFAALPIQMVTIGSGDQRIAVHVAGRLASNRVPVVCVPSYQRNMSDFADFIGYFASAADADWPVVLLDLRGRGRSSDRRIKADYASPNDAHDLVVIARALGIETAVFLGQGYGGQVVMALAAERPSLVAGAVLIDAGPLSDPRGLVRLHRNMALVEGMQGPGLRSMFRQMLAVSYPGAAESRLDALAARTHYFDKRHRARALFDPHLITLLAGFEQDDALVAQWPLFNALADQPLLLMKTQLTDQLRRDTFDEMLRRRPDATGLMIADQGSPALLDHRDEVGAIATFVGEVNEGLFGVPPGRAAAPNSA